MAKKAKGKRKTNGARMGAPVKFNRVKQVRAKQLLVIKGRSTTQVATALKLSYATVRNWQKAGMPLRAA